MRGDHGGYWDNTVAFVKRKGGPAYYLHVIQITENLIGFWRDWITS